MWDTVPESDLRHRQLSRDLPCLACGHAAHTYLECDAVCGCRPAVTPGIALP